MRVLAHAHTRSAVVDAYLNSAGGEVVSAMVVVAASALYAIETLDLYLLTLAACEAAEVRVCVPLRACVCICVCVRMCLRARACVQRPLATRLPAHARDCT